ncbi:g2538 [Coccomyxa elongata]
MTGTQEAAQPEKGPDHLEVQLAAAKESLTQQRSEHAAVETRLKIEVEVQKRQLKEKTNIAESQAACIETLTKERAASEEQWSAKVEVLQSQLEQQAGMTADQIARTEKLEAALKAAEAAATAAQEDARPAEASSDLSDSHVLLRAARIMQMDPTLKQELLSLINM